MDKKAKFSAFNLLDVPTGQLPEHLELQRTRVVCKSDAPIHTEGVNFSGAYAAMGVDNSLRLGSFCENFRVVVNRLTEDEMEFDMIGSDAALANVFRRILIAEKMMSQMSGILLYLNYMLCVKRWPPLYSEVRSI